MESFLLMVVGVVAGLLYHRLQERLQQTESDVTQSNANALRLQQQVELLQRELRELRALVTSRPPAAQSSIPIPPTPAPAPARAHAVAPPALAAILVAAPPVSVPPAPVAPPVLHPTPPAPAPPVAAPVATPVPAPPVPPKPVAPEPAPIPPQPVYRPAPVPAAPTEPTWWARVSGAMLKNWTGILGAVILVTGVGFLGVYTALQLEPIHRFILINGFALSLLGARQYLKSRPYGAQLSQWLQSSAAAIFLFTCVAAVSMPGLRWATTPLDYLLLFAGAGVNLYLA